MDVNGSYHGATADVAVAVVAGMRSYWMRRMKKDQKKRSGKGWRTQAQGRKNLLPILGDG